MKPALIYSLKVWLTSCLLVNLFWTIGYTILYLGSVPLYILPFSLLLLILATIIFSSLTWLAFFLMLLLLLKYSPLNIKAKALLLGLLLVSLTFGLFMYFFPGFDRMKYSLLMVGHCIVVALGIWYYKPFYELKSTNNADL